MKREVSVEFEMLHKGPTTTGLGEPKFYLWITVTARDETLAEGAARVRAVSVVIHLGGSPNCWARISGRSLVDWATTFSKEPRQFTDEESVSAKDYATDSLGLVPPHIGDEAKSMAYYVSAYPTLEGDWRDCFKQAKSAYETITKWNEEN
jgi:hypothetical protein